MSRPAEYINNPNQTVLFAYSGEELAGGLVIRQWWNNFAYIEDITVKAGLKRQGIGRALMKQAIDWAKGRQLPGVMLETQNTNVAACRFYEKCGFELCGFDGTYIELYTRIARRSRCTGICCFERPTFTCAFSDGGRNTIASAA